MDIIAITLSGEVPFTGQRWSDIPSSKDFRYKYFNIRLDSPLALSTYGVVINHISFSFFYKPIHRHMSIYIYI